MEGVVGVGKQVDIIAGEVVDEVEIGKADFLAVETDSVTAIVLGLEVDGQFALALAADHGIIGAVNGDEQFGAAFPKLELG